MESNLLGVQPTMAIGHNNGDMMGGSWLWVILLFFLFFGFGGNGMNGNNQQLVNQAFQSQRDTLENRYTNQLGMQTLGQQLSNCCCETQRSIDAVRADGYRNTCDITTAIHAEGEQTRALINSLELQSLRDKLDEKTRNLATAEFQISQINQTSQIVNQLQPQPKPAYLAPAPGTYYPYAYPYGSENV